MNNKSKYLVFVFLILALFAVPLAAFAQTEETGEETGEVIVGDYKTTYSKDGEVFVITNTRGTDTVEITAKKIWNDGSNVDNSRPENVSFQLYKDGTAEGDPVTVTGTGDTWSHTWSGLQKNIAGTAIVWTVDEVTTPTGYTKSLSADNLTVTNTRAIDTKVITITWDWSDENDRDNKRPDAVSIDVKRGDDVVQTVAFPTADSKWTTTVTVPANTPGSVGVPAVYTVGSTDLLASYTEVADAENTETSVKLTGTYTPERVDIQVRKTWADSGNQDKVRPTSIRVNLKNQDGIVATHDMTGDAAANDWTYTFEDQYVYTAGTKNIYSVEEVAIP